MKIFFPTSTIFTKIFLHFFFRTYFTSESYIEFKFFVPLLQNGNWTRYFTSCVSLFTKRASLCWAL